MQGKQGGGILGTNRRRNVVPKCIVSFFQVYEYYTTPVEPQERVRTMETLNMSERSTTTTDDVYEVYIKRKDVKHKWSQTEDFDQGSDGLKFNIRK